MLSPMRIWVFTLGLVLSATSVASAGPGTAPIIGGTTTTVGQYPTVVALLVGGGGCTGTLIHKDWVLTAAHCISPDVLGLPDQAAVTADVRVYFNTVNINTTAGRANVRRASMTIPKPSFNINGLGANDVGLIKLSTPINDIVPSPVNLDPAMAPVGTVVTMVGFGITSGDGSASGVEYALTGRASTNCSQYGLTNANLLCFNQTDNKGKCSGDSGGPSFAMMNGALTVVGITSFGDQGCTTFGADTRTDAEKTFLHMYLPDLGVKPCTMDSECANMGVCFNARCIAQPFAPTGIGSECTGGGQCESNTCAAGPGDEMRCTFTCTPKTEGACPDGFECLEAGAGGACWPESDDGGCCDAGNPGAGTALFGLGLFALVLRRRRRSCCA